MTEGRPVSLQAAMESDSIRPGGKCPVRVLIDGGVPVGSANDAPLEPEDREYLAHVTSPGSTHTLTKAHRYLTNAGYKVGSTSLGAHRRRSCACP